MKIIWLKPASTLPCRPERAAPADGPFAKRTCWRGPPDIGEMLESTYTTAGEDGWAG